MVSTGRQRNAGSHPEPIQERIDIEKVDIAILIAVGGLPAALRVLRQVDPRPGQRGDERVNVVEVDLPVAVAVSRQHTLVQEHRYVSIE